MATMTLPTPGTLLLFPRRLGSGQLYLYRLDPTDYLDAWALVPLAPAQPARLGPQTITWSTLCAMLLYQHCAYLQPHFGLHIQI